MGFSQGFAPTPAPTTAPSRMTITLTSLQSGGFGAPKTVTMPNPTFTLTVTP